MMDCDLLREVAAAGHAEQMRFVHAKVVEQIQHVLRKPREGQRLIDSRNP